MEKGSYKLGISVFIVMSLLLSLFVIATDNVTFNNETKEKTQDNLTEYNFSESKYHSEVYVNNSEIEMNITDDNNFTNPIFEENLTEVVLNILEDEVKKENYCEEDFECVWAIRDDDCCSCPHIEARTNLQKDNNLVSFRGYKRRSEGETYPALSKMDCSNAMCREPCLPTSQLKCIDNKCQRGYIAEVYHLGGSSQ